MFTSNPFAELSASIPTVVMQGYIVLMVLLVIGGTILDMMHKKSAQYFFENAKKAQKSAKRSVGGWRKSIDCRFSAGERSINFWRIQQYKTQAFPSVDHVRIHYFRCDYRDHDFWLSDAGNAHTCLAATAMAYRRTDAGRWWILVLVFYPR